MSIRPLDLQVNINSMLETSKTEAMKQSMAAQEQRIHDERSQQESKNRENMVNASEKADVPDNLKDTDSHFGAKTESEMEEEFSRDNQKKKRSDSEHKKPDEHSSGDHTIDVLA